MESLVGEQILEMCPKGGGRAIITYFKCKRLNGCNPVVIQGNLLQALQALECLKWEKCTYFISYLSLSSISLYICYLLSFSERDSITRWIGFLFTWHKDLGQENGLEWF